MLLQRPCISTRDCKIERKISFDRIEACLVHGKYETTFPSTLPRVSSTFPVASASISTTLPLNDHCCRMVVVANMTAKHCLKSQSMQLGETSHHHQHPDFSQPVFIGQAGVFCRYGSPSYCQCCHKGISLQLFTGSRQNINSGQQQSLQRRLSREASTDDVPRQPIAQRGG